MRRISPEYARLGMILGRAVYDSSGSLVLDAGTVLDAAHRPVLSRVETREIIVQDPRVDDVIIVPSVPEEVEAQGIRALHRLIDENCGRLVEHIKLDLISLDRTTKAMVQGFYNAFMGEFSNEGCLSLTNYDYVHPVKVAGISMLVGKTMGYSKTDMIALGMASFLQNIGYISMPDSIATNIDESAEVIPTEFKAHTEAGYHVVCKCTDLDDKIAQAVLQHHERWNGSGFPRALKGTAISPFARIIAIASAFYCLISRRPGRQPYSPPEAAEYVIAYSGEYFDPDMVQVFIRNVAFYPKGIMVRLNTGEAGIVIDANIGYIGRPMVRICYRHDNTEIHKPYDIDLTDQEHQNKRITEILEY